MQSQWRISIRAAAGTILALCVCMAAVVAFVEPAATQSLKSKKSELQKLKEQISKFEQRLKNTETREKNTLQQIDTYDQQTALIRNLIERLSRQVEENKRDIELAESSLVKAEERLRQLQGVYTRYIVSVYKRGTMHDTELLLSSRSLNQMLIRARYLKAITAKHRVEAEDIRQARRAIQRQKTILEEQLERQRQALQNKSSEEESLQRKVQKHKQLLARVRQDKEYEQTFIRRKEAAARKVASIISSLVEKSRKKIKKGSSEVASSEGVPKKSFKDKVTDLPTSIKHTKFGKKRGSLPWPVSGGKVITKFGEQRNAELNTVTINPGIDIRVKEGSSVKAIADGRVTSVDFIPGFGNILIIDHDEDFRSVYAHLNSFKVKINQKVKAGQVIAKSGETVAGPQIHFELWHSRTKQNPLHWLAR